MMANSRPRPPSMDLLLPSLAVPSLPPHKNILRCGIVFTSSAEKMELKFTNFKQLLEYLLKKCRDKGMVETVKVFIPYHQFCKPCQKYFDRSLEKFIACTKKPRVQKLANINIKRVEATHERQMNVSCYKKVEPSCSNNNRQEEPANYFTDALKKKRANIEEAKDVVIEKAATVNKMNDDSSEQKKVPRDFSWRVSRTKN